MSKAKVNPHCPVTGCRASRPHKDDPMVRRLASFTNTPQVYLHWVLQALEELRDSMIEDHKAGRRLSWEARIRIVEELYYRTLYMLFVATPEEALHVLSGEVPNSISIIYQELEQKLFGYPLGMRERYSSLGGRSLLEWLHNGAHGAFPMLLMMELNGKSKGGFKGYKKDVLDFYIKNIITIGVLIVVKERSLDEVRQKLVRMHKAKLARKAEAKAKAS